MLSRNIATSGANQHNTQFDWAIFRSTTNQDNAGPYESDEKERKLLHDLAIESGDCERNKNINPERVPETCEWFLQDERFHKWRDSKSGDLLWVSAGPGRGKSVLSKCLIDEGHLNSKATITTTSSANMVPERVVCYFFFNDGGEGEMDGAHALSALLHQLFKQASTAHLISHALSSHKFNSWTLTRKMGELWRILVECANSSPVPIVCVLDALDECKEYERNGLIDKLYELYHHNGISSSSLKLKFLVTSRPYDKLKISFDRLTTSSAYLHFDGDDKSEQIGQEINRVIDFRLENITSSFSAQDRDNISKRLKSMENRTYLWLDLTLDIIETNISAFSRKSDMEEFLSKLPSAVSDAYEKILSRSQDEKKVTALLQIVLAAERPLTLVEANFALTLALEKEQPPRPEDLLKKLWPKEEDFKNTVQNLCGLFISIYDSKLSFIHQTAREFLIHPERTGAWKGRLSLSKSHGILSGACINYLLMIDTPLKHRNRTEACQRELYAVAKQYAFFYYAVKYWPLHFCSQDSDSAEMYWKPARDLCRASAPQSQNWTLCTGLNDLEERDWERWADLHIAAYVGLAAVVNDIMMHEHADVNAGALGRSCGSDNPLHMAMEQGHLEVGELLLDSNNRVRVTEGKYAVIAAAINKWRAAAMMALLLGKRGDEIEITEDVLVNAVRNELGGVATLALLLDKRPHDVKITQNIVREAAEYGSIETMSLLLEKRGQEVKITEEIVEAAVENMLHGLQIITLLLDKRGHEITITDEIVNATSRNWGQGLQILSLLVEKRSHEVKMTKEIVEAASRNSPR